MWGTGVASEREEEASSALGRCLPGRLADALAEVRGVAEAAFIRNLGEGFPRGFEQGEGRFKFQVPEFIAD